MRVVSMVLLMALMSVPLRDEMRVVNWDVKKAEKLVQWLAVE